MQLQRPNIKKSEFPQYDKDPKFKTDAVNRLYYGFQALKVSRKGKSTKRVIFYLLEDDPNILQWLSNKKEYTNARINLLQIKSILYSYRYKIQDKNCQEDQENRLISLQTPQYDLGIFFDSKEDRDKFHYALQTQIFKNFEKEQEKSHDKAELLTNKFFLKADKDGSKQLDFKEFLGEFKKLHTNISAKKLKTYFDKYDTDNSGTIEKNELKNIFRDMLYKEEVLEIYLMYCKKAQDIFTEKFQTEQNLSNNQLEENKQNIGNNQSQENLGTQNSLNKDHDSALKQIKEGQKKNKAQKIRGGESVYIKDYFKLMTVKELAEFYKQEQGDIVDEKELRQSLIDIYKDDYYEAYRDMFDGEEEKKKKMEELKQKDNGIFDDKDLISLYQFHNLLFGKNNLIFKPEKQHEFMDMTKPLSDYYINSSHNTYLMANQLTGDSNVQAYVNSFLKGSKCVELDIWNGKIKGQNVPIITHGHTLTSKITFEEVILCIKDHAFLHSQYPAVLSFENHCSQDQQKIMAEILEKHLGDMIFKLPVDAENLRCFTNLDKMKGKIILKGKQKLQTVLQQLYPDYQQKQQKKNLYQDEEIPIEKNVNLSALVNLDDSAVNEVEHAQDPQYLIPIKKTNLDNVGKKDYNHDEDQADETGKKDGNEEAEYVFELAKLLSMLGLKMNYYDQNRSPWHISAVKEHVLGKLLKKEHDDLIYWHRSNLTRVYPKGLRIDSSNYNPLPSMIAGSQIIALNFQTDDLFLLVYLGMFQQNGYSGYILKPKWMRLGEPLKSLFNDFRQVQLNLSVTVISGQFLRPFDNKGQPTDIVDPFVEIQIMGYEEDEKNNKAQKTHVIDDNGFNPVWTSVINDENRKEINFQIRCPEFAQLIIQVYDKDPIGKEKLGWYSLPVTCIREGFRVVPLLDKKMNRMENSTLFCHFNLNGYTVTDDDRENINLKQYNEKRVSIQSQFDCNKASIPQKIENGVENNNNTTNAINGSTQPNDKYNLSQKEIDLKE